MIYYLFKYILKERIKIMKIQIFLPQLILKRPKYGFSEK